jgi:hypothetical protein
MTANRNRSVRSEHRLFKFESYVFAQVGAALAMTAAAGSATKDFAESEKVPENIAEVVENCRIETRAARARSTAHTGVAEAVIKRAFFIVRQNGIGFATLFKFLLRIRIVRIAVRMKLHGQPAISALYFLIARAARQAEDIVIIAFYIASQNNLSPV